MKWRLPFDADVLLRACCALVTLVAVVALCAFKLMDRDFYWHITAGEMMVRTWGVIRTDPFSYVRAGLPYASTHGWLSQLLLYGVWHLGGVAGVSALRAAAVVTALAVIVSAAGRRISPFVFPFAILACATGLGAFLERPQLFSFVCFALTLRFALAWLEEHDASRRRRILAWWVGTAVVWVNLHGAAVLLGGGVAAAMGLAALPSLWHGGADARRRWAELWTLAALLSLALLASPSGVGNLSYLWLLFTDRTSMFISEWLPRASAEYWRDQGVWWLAAPALLWFGKRQRLFFALLFVIFAWLSRQALRHEVLFVLTSLFIVTAQLSGDALQATLAASHERHPRIMRLCALLFLALSCVWAHSFYVRLCQRDHLYGYGTFAPARGAADYLEKNGVTGNMFNTYGVGGYLMHRGYSVFIDGRNVDYGFEHMAMTNVAGKDAAAFAELERRHDFAYAVVDYDAAKEPGLVSYSVHLDLNPAWALVYLDDWSAVYLKRTEKNAALIRRDAYRALSPTTLEVPEQRKRAGDENRDVFVAELRRAADGEQGSVKALNHAASLLMGEGKCAEARPLLEESLRRQPRRPDPFVLLAACATQEGDAVAAAGLFDRALPLLGDAFPDFRYDYVAGVYAAAGRPWKARLLHAYAGEWQLVLFGERDTGGDAPLVNPAAEGLSRFESAMRLIEEGRFQDAEQELLRALMLNPSHAEAWNNLGALRIDLKRYAEAKDALTRALENKKDYADAELNMAIVLWYLGDAAAAAHLERAAALGADTAAVRALLAR